MLLKITEVQCFLLFLVGLKLILIVILKANQGKPGSLSYGGVFRNPLGFVQGCFAYKLRNGFTFEVELLGAMIVILMASLKGWNKLLIEYDFTYIIGLL